MAAPPQVSALRTIEFGVPDVAAAARFYGETWGLASVGGDRGAAYLRGTGSAHPIVALRQAPTPELRAVGLAAADKATVDALHARALGHGAKVLDAPGPLGGPGEPYGFAFADTEGRRFVVSCAREGGGDADAIDRPRKLSHVVLNCRAAERATEFFVDLLGFRLSDRTAMMDFIRCNADHHALAFVRTGRSSLNHVAFEMPSFDALMRGTGRMKDAGYPVEWGVGRHGPGNNIFNYFIDPHGLVIEYTSDVDQIVDEAAHRVGTPADWKWPPNRIDRWGYADPPSARVRAAMDGDVVPVANVGT